MGLFTDIGYSLLAKQRRERFEREGRTGESLGFYNRPDLNHPWDQKQPMGSFWFDALMVALIVVGSLGFGAFFAWLDHLK